MSDQPEAPGLSFIEFVLGLATNAAVHFGDIPDPISGERSRSPISTARRR